MLIRKNPNLTLRNKKGKTAIDVAFSKEIIEVFQKYLKDEMRENQTTNRNSPVTRYLVKKKKPVVYFVL